MEKLLEKISILKEELDQTTQVKNIQALNIKLKQNKQLMDKIALYSQTRKESIKEEIYSDELFQQYKKAETELNVLVLEVNSKLKKINSKGKCNIWK